MNHTGRRKRKYTYQYQVRRLFPSGRRKIVCVPQSIVTKPNTSLPIAISVLQSEQNAAEVVNETASFELSLALGARLPCAVHGKKFAPKRVAVEVQLPV
jgi:hypothetical protein